MNPLPTASPPGPPARSTRRLARLAPLIAILLALLPGAPATGRAPAGELPAGCFELVLNGGFELLNTVWFLPPSLTPGVYDNSLAFAGNYSMRLGNIDAQNVVSQSRAEQTINLPANANSIVLSFRYYGRIDGNPVGANDRQYLDIFNAGTNQFLIRPFDTKNNDRVWLGAQYSLTAYRGQQVRLSFGVDNDGADARIAMNIDEVSVYYCTTTPVPTATPTPTWTPTFLPTFVPTFFPTLFPTPFPTPVPTWGQVPGCGTDILVNGNFEGSGGWEFGQTALPGQFLGTFPQGGARLVQLGNPPNYRPDTHSFSSIRQLVTIPANAGQVELRWFHWFGTQEMPSDSIPAGSDRQELVLLNPDLSTLAVAFRTRRNEGGWVQEITDLSAYRGRTLYIYFNALNDGNNARTWMYLDSVQLCLFQAAQPFQPGPQVQPTYSPATPIFIPTYAPTFAPGNTPFPTVYIPPTVTPTPTDFANPAPLGVATFPPGPDVAPGEPTPDMGGAPQADTFGLVAAASTGTPAEIAAAETTTPRRGVGVIAAMCGIVLVIALLGVGIIRAISGSRTGAPP